VAHKKLVLPQLGAPGVNANEIRRLTGFNVVYGPVRARDIKAFLEAGNKATDEMRRVRFTMWDRLVLAPMEFVEAAKMSLTVFGVLFLVNLVAARPFGVRDFLAYCAAIFIGTVATPVLLPFIPGRAFAFKGWLLGMVGTALLAWAFGWFAPSSLVRGIGYMFALPAVSAFWAMNFTGASTYTSPSGVLKEMKAAIPLMLVAFLAGMVFVLAGAFMGTGGGQ
jgi:hypothetical protein